MPKRTAYEDLPFLPNLLAETVCAQTYTGSEMGQRSSLFCPSQSVIDKTEEARLAMTPDQIREFSDLCDQRCKLAYEAKAEWFMKCVRATGNNGRDRLFMWLTHWMASFLKNPTEFKERCTIVCCTFEEIKKAIADFGKLQRQLSKFGATDTEPDGEFQVALVRAFNGKSPRVPQDVEQWELYSTAPESAAKQLTSATQILVNMIKGVKTQNRPRLQKYLKSFCWRVTWET